MEISSINKLILPAPIDRWDEAVPLGNGLLGVLLWGQDTQIRLSLDRGDLWDHRTSPVIASADWNWANIQRIVASGDATKLAELVDVPYYEPYPTKIPAGRLELELGEGQNVCQFELDMTSAEGAAELTQGRLRVFVSALEPLIMVRCQGFRPSLKMLAPAFAKDNEPVNFDGGAMGSLGRLGYPAAQTGLVEEIRYYRQTCAQEVEYAVVCTEKATPDGCEIAITVTTNEGEDAVALGIRQVRQALQQGYQTVFDLHRQWWEQFWSRSTVCLPDAAIQQHYLFCQYMYGSTSRRQYPPMPLQGVWTADEGALPPWKGDYHNDLNTQMCYWAYHAADHMDEGLSFLDFMWRLLPRHRQFAKEFYATDGAVIPGVMALNGQEMGGWGQYSLSPTNGAWVAHNFYLHWRYSMDEQFLVQRAYPYCLAVAQGIDGLLKEDAAGKLKLPLSSSPEIHDNRMEAYMRPNTNYDLSLMRWLFSAVAEMGDELGYADQADYWRQRLAKLEELATGSNVPNFGDGELLWVASDQPLAESHRHFSHLMAIYPLGTLHVDAGDAAKKLIHNSLLQLDLLGSDWWCGYTYAWLACMAARVGQAERAAQALRSFLSGFVSRNGFHLNGDFKNTGFSRLKYRPFTLEGNFAAAQAVHEMLLQSWGGVLRIFPAIPDAWSEVSFHDLRAEGALRISALRCAGRTQWLSIHAEKDAEVVLRDPFMGATVHWNSQDICQRNDSYRISLKAGHTITAKRETVARHDNCGGLTAQGNAT